MVREQQNAKLVRAIPTGIEANRPDINNKTYDEKVCIKPWMLLRPSNNTMYTKPIKKAQNEDHYETKYDKKKHT